MRRTLRLVSLAGFLALSPPAPLPAQSAVSPAALDSLLDRLVGHWTMRGTVRGRPASYTLDAARTLKGRFVELHMRDVHEPPAYEARVFIGVDSAGKRYVAHWLDNFGAAYSIPPATGTARGDTLELDFPYPDGAFHDTFIYQRPSDAWTMRLESADGAGGWKLFAEYSARRR
jgi:uncharacterized protein DUF1579